MLQRVIWQIFLVSSTNYHQRVWQWDVAVEQWEEDGWLYLIHKGEGIESKSDFTS